MKFKKYLLGLALALSFNAHANIYCDQNGSSNSILTPMFLTGGSFSGYFFVTNVSEEPVTVNLDFADSNGNAFTPSSGVLYAANFSSGNTPLSTGGATLQPGQMGEIVITNGVSGRVNVGKLSWTSSACLKSALMVNYLNELTESSRYSASTLALNGGQPF